MFLFSLQFSLCYIHPQHKAVTEVWSTWSFSCIAQHIVELKKQTNHISQTDIVQLIFKSQLASVLIWRHVQVLRSQGWNCSFLQLIIRTSMDFKFHHQF